MFTAVWQVSQACARNCSFSSGEAASAAVLPVLVLLLPRRWRLAALVLLVPFAVAASVNRIAFGSHFLSDVLVSWLFVAIGAAVMQRLVARGAPGSTLARTPGRGRSPSTSEHLGPRGALPSFPALC